MAIGTSHPPRAYTREILTAAFNWLQSQPDSVRTQATTPDALVGLYTRAHRFGSTNLETEAPVSSQNFMSDLKNLAEGLKAFDGAKPPQRQSPAATMPPKASAFFDQPSSPQAVPLTLAPSPAPHAPAPQVTAPTPDVPTLVASALGMTATLPGLNERSLQMLQEVQSTLNLSSDSEAANLMIALAYKSLKASLLV